MRCEVAREALSARVDGERETVPSARVDEHVAECPDCAEWYRRLQTLAIPHVRDSLRMITDDQPDLTDRILEAAEDGRHTTPWGPDRRTRLWWTAAGVGAVVSGALIVALVVTAGSVAVAVAVACAMVLTIALTVRARRDRPRRVPGDDAPTVDVPAADDAAVFDDDAIDTALAEVRELRRRTR
ncbi:zf-HC2 domain-containing protein [Gordonia sp. NPDC003376]